VETPDSWHHGTICAPCLSIHKKGDGSALREAVNKHWLL